MKSSSHYGGYTASLQQHNLKVEKCIMSFSSLCKIACFRKYGIISFIQKLNALLLVSLSCLSLLPNTCHFAPVFVSYLHFYHLLLKFSCCFILFLDTYTLGFHFFVSFSSFFSLSFLCLNLSAFVFTSSM